MKSLLKRIVLMFLCMTFIFTLTGCFSENQNDNSSETPQDEVITLHYGFSRYVSCFNFEDDQTAGMYYNFGGKYDGLSAQLFKGGGIINGQIEQTILKGNKGSEVTAVPFYGFEFVMWSDGLKTPTRSDSSTSCYDLVDSAKKDMLMGEVYPLFAKIYTFTFLTTEGGYNTNSGGYIIGETTQTITTGQCGTELKAVANDGYVFMGWFYEDDYGMVDTTTWARRLSNSETFVYDPFEYGLTSHNRIYAGFYKRNN